jgi:hypothetical protein
MANTLHVCAEESGFLMVHEVGRSAVLSSRGNVGVEGGDCDPPLVLKHLFEWPDTRYIFRTGTRTPVLRGGVR